jgi:drug/metabolite transporter (DMT)-like permease
VVPDAAFGALCAALSALAWAVIGLLVRSLSATFNSLALNAIRSLLGGALILLWVLAVDGLGGIFSMSARAFWLLSISMLLAVGVGDTVFFESTRGLGLARAMTLAMTYPLIAALLAVAALGEPLSLHVAVGSLLTLAGVVMTVGLGPGETAARDSVRLGVAAALLAAVAWAVSVVMLKPSLQEVDAIRAQAVRLPLAGVLLGATPWTWRIRVPPDGRASGLAWRLGALGALTAVSSVSFVAGVQYAGVAVATVLSSIAPIFAIPLGVLFLGERPTSRTVAGTIVTILGIAVLQR